MEISGFRGTKPYITRIRAAGMDNSWASCLLDGQGCVRGPELSVWKVIKIDVWKTGRMESED